MNTIKKINGVDYQVILVDKANKKAILKQVSHLTKCLMYGGQYTVVDGRKTKHYCTLECAQDLYNKIHRPIETKVKSLKK